MENLLIIIVAIASLGLCTFSLVVTLKSYQKSKDRAEQAMREALMSIQREDFEKRMYLEKQQYLNNMNRFQDLNNLYMSSQEGLHITSKVRNDSFFQDMGINISSIQVKKRTAMCIMPFHSMFRRTYEFIRDACKVSNVLCVRSDEEFLPTTILQHIITLIAQSEIIIAVIDGQNANVTYELGIAHALGKPVILLADVQNVKKIPTDILPQNILLYKSYSELYEKLSRTIRDLYVNQNNQ